jgi:glycosyltransferase involved in cell wall biosynthesis
LWIVGAKPTADVRALEAAGGITVTGTVDDVRRYYGNALAAVVPLRTGGGTRLKILEAMAAGVPVISTPLGAEGLDVHPDRDILMVAPDDTAGWAACVARLADSATLRAELTSAAAALVGERYDWDHLGKQLGGFYQRWLEAAR